MKAFFSIAFILVSCMVMGQAVGIGTTTPTPGYLLDVNGNVNSKGLRLTSPGNYFIMVDGNNSNKLFRYTVNGGYLRNAYNSLSPFSTKDVMVIDSTGKVGIGSGNPTAWLDVNNNSGSQIAKFNGGNNMWLTLAENGANRGYIGSYLGNAEDIDFGTYSGNSTGKIHLATNGTPRITVHDNGDITMKNLSTAFDLNLQSNTSRNINFVNNANTTEAIIKSSGNNLYLGRGNVFTDLTIDADGDVGIGGEIVPVSQLQVVGGDEVSLTQHGTLMLGTVALPNIVFDENEIQSRNNGAGTDLFMQHNGGNLLLCGNELGAVGIGLIAGSSIPAGSLLAVDGKITCEEVLVKMSQNWPDYVFANDYKLPDLSDVKSFIQKNKHLPGIPKASDIEKDGLELGALQRMMMEKIEELTLYVIKLQEEVQYLKSKK